MPLRMTDAYVQPIIDNLDEYFYQLFWKDILDLLDFKRPRVNRNNGVADFLIEAIRRGEITYQNGVFRGTFNARISRELSQFAKFDRREKVWKGNPPPEVKGAAIVARTKAEQLMDQIRTLIDEIPARVADEVERLRYNLDEPLFSMVQVSDNDLRNLGIDLQFDDQFSQRIIEDYTNNQNRNIVDFTPVQVTRLREMVERNVLRGYNRVELQEMIAAEYNTTMNKARFLARQETRLFMSAVRDERYRKGGIRVVQWSTADDIRVVGNPTGLYPDPTPGHGNHYALHNKYCLLSDPTVYADTLEDAQKGLWKSKAMIGGGVSHAGVEFGCRCTYKPVLL